MKVNHIVVTGFMATGKTTVAPEISQILKIPWIDLDQEIENRLQKKISAIFITEGEEYFRSKENKIFTEVLASNNARIISTGGGTLINDRSRALALEQSTVFCLQASKKTLTSRLSKSKRPLAGNWQNILNQREDIYAQFPYQIQVDEKTPFEIAQEIVTIWQKISM